MIPIRDNQASYAVPIATYGIMGMTLLGFAWQLSMGLGNEAVFYLYGFVPGKYTIADLAVHFTGVNKLVSPLSYMFLHGGFWHFLGNMWFLYIFGNNIEAYLGPARFLGFYLISGLLSALFHFVLNFYSPVPTIGASGAIAGVMGAYFLLYPRSKILTLVPILIFPVFIEIPAFIFLGFWFLIQFFNAAGQGAGSGVAWWAHVGGFLAGVVLIRLNAQLPSTGMREKIVRFTRKKNTPKLQVITPVAMDNGSDLQGSLELSFLEALAGTRKLITIPWGFKKPLYRVVVPAGIRQGTRLRLRGMGRQLPGRPKGDLFLKVKIRHAL